MGRQQFTELARIPIRVGPPRDDGRLAPIVDGDTVLLRSKVPEKTSAAIGVNVDSLLILDASADGTVFEVELLVPRSAWRFKDSTPRPVPGIEKGSIIVADPGPRIYVDQISPCFTVDSQGRLYVRLEPVDGETRWVALSAECFALLNDGFLAGFVTLLPR